MGRAAASAVVVVVTVSMVLAQLLIASIAGEILISEIGLITEVLVVASIITAV